MIKILITFFFFIYFSLPQKKLQKDLIGYIVSSQKVDFKKVSHLTHLILFSAEINKDATLKIKPSLKKLLVLIKNKNFKNKKKILCIGGWGRSEYFSAMTKTLELRKKLIKNIVTIVKKYNLDGVDYDWEHPQNQQQEKNYVALIKETHEKSILVTIAAAGHQKFKSEVFKYLYRVNLMGYDHPGRHSTLNKIKKDIDNFLKMGCPANKIALGVPFYGRHIKNRKAKSFRYLSYKITNNFIDEIDGYYFNNIKTLTEKVNLVKKLNLAGIMIWQINQDTKEGKLLKTLSKNLKKIENY